jgi:hypothetical protein
MRIKVDENLPFSIVECSRVSDDPRPAVREAQQWELTTAEVARNVHAHPT